MEWFGVGSLCRLVGVRCRRPDAAFALLCYWICWNENWFSGRSKKFSVQRSAPLRPARSAVSFFSALPLRLNRFRSGMESDGRDGLGGVHASIDHSYTVLSYSAVQYCSLLDSVQTTFRA